MINYESQIQPLEAAGKSDAEIVKQLQSDPRHKRDIMATSSNPDVPDILGILVGRYQLLRLGVDATWKGPLVDYFADPNVNRQLKVGFEMLLAQLQISNRRIWCNGVAAQGFLVSAMTQVSAGIVKAMGGDAVQLQTDMDGLTGGLLYANLTEQDIADARTEYQQHKLQESLLPLREKIASAYNATVAAIDAGEAVDAESASKVFAKGCE